MKEWPPILWLEIHDQAKNLTSFRCPDGEMANYVAPENGTNYTEPYEGITLLFSYGCVINNASNKVVRDWVRYEKPKFFMDNERILIRGLTPLEAKLLTMRHLPDIDGLVQPHFLHYKHRFLVLSS